MLFGWNWVDIPLRGGTEGDEGKTFEQISA